MRKLERIQELGAFSWRSFLLSCCFEGIMRWTLGSLNPEQVLHPFFSRLPSASILYQPPCLLALEPQVLPLSPRFSLQPRACVALGFSIPISIIMLVFVIRLASSRNQTSLSLVRCLSSPLQSDGIWWIAHVITEVIEYADRWWLWV